MLLRLAILLSALTLPLCAAPVVSPPVEMLAPLRHDFPRKGPPISLRDNWAELTRGTNLALGRPYRYDRKPNYGATADAGDATQLTDGKIIAGDHIWYYKDAVGFCGADPPATICLDLGQVSPIEAVVAHVQGVGAHEASLRYPIRLDVYVSDDGETYTLVDSLMKREYLDQQGAFYDLPEATGNFPPGNPHTHAFHFGNLQTRGRYVALRLTFAGAYNALDEIAVMKGDHDPATVTLHAGPATRLVFDGVELIYPRAWLQVPTNVAGGFSFALRDSRTDKRRPVTFHVDVPAAVTLSWPGEPPLEARDHTEGGAACREYRLTTAVRGSSLGYFYVQAGPGELGDMVFHAEVPGCVQPTQRVKLVPCEIPPAPALTRLVLAHGWTGTDLQSKWPGGPAALRHLGFTHASVGSWETPGYYQTPQAAASQEWIETQARPAGLRVCMTDSPFHIMEDLWRGQPDFAQAYAQTDPPTKRLCLSYRGKFYHQEVARIADRVRFRKPDLVFFDVECFGGADRHVQDCTRCRKLLQERGREPRELATDLYAEMGRDIAAAIAKVAGELGRPVPPLGYYHVSPAYVYHNVFDFAKLYPASTQFDSPEVYCRCHPPAVAEIIRHDKRLLPPACPVIAWTSPGTLDWEGEVAPARFFDALLEEFCNGATGTAYYTPTHLSTEDLAAQALVTRLLAPVEDIIAGATLCDTARWIEGGRGHVSAIRHGPEQLVLVADYARLGPSEVAVRIPVDEPVSAVDLFTGKATALSPAENRLTVRIEGAYRSRPFYVGRDWERRMRGS